MLSSMKSIFAILLLFHLANAVPTGTHDSYLSFERSPPDNLADFLRVRQAFSFGAPSAGFVPLEFSTRNVLMINGTADDSFMLSFVTEKGSNVTEYEFKFFSNDTDILMPEQDLSTSRTVSETFVNITSIVEFRRFPGLVQLTIEAIRADGSLFDSIQIHFLAAGMVLYVKESRTIISGFGRSFDIEDYSLVNEKQLWDLGVFIQFLNGSNSNELLVATDSAPPYFSLADIEANLSSFEGQILWDPSTCSISGGQWNGSDFSLSQGCGMGFSIGRRNGSVYDGCHFAFLFEKNRAGDFIVLFKWRRFTEGSDLDDELYMTYILVVISGAPPAIVRRIEPGNPYSRDGGEELYVEMINSGDLNITSFNVNDVPFLIIPGSRQFITGPDDFYETAKFLTKPGTGKRLPWTISATKVENNKTAPQPAVFVDESGFLFSYDDEEVFIISISPDLFPETGGVEAVLSGNFTAFASTALNHNVIIGNYILRITDFVSVTETEIRIIIPPRATIGSAWKFGIIVQIASSFSNRVFFSYYALSLRLSPQVYGASKDFDSDNYVLSACGTTTFVVNVMNKVEDNVIFEWTMLEASGQAVPLLDNDTMLVTDTNTLELPNSLVSEDEVYELTAIATEGDVSATHTFHVTRSASSIVGVTIVQPENRTIASPAVNLRIVSKIDIPPCVTDARSLTYHWLYENKLNTVKKATNDGVTNPDIFNASLAPVFSSFVFSYRNDTGTLVTDITPTRLGRELIIPMDHLQYGLHRIRLEVSSENATVFGRASSTVLIFEPPLTAWIGAGEEQREVSDSEDLLITGEGSRDPDVLSSASNSSVGLTYEWSCSYFLYSNKSQRTPCGADLLPFRNQSSFLITKNVLQTKRYNNLNETEGRLQIEYRLTVSKGSRTGSVTQILSVVNSEGLMLARYDRIEVSNSRGLVNLNAVEFWEDIVIQPIAPTSTQWRFRLEEPVWERSTFIAGNNKLIIGPGYYSSTGSSDPGYQTLPLGIYGGKLRSHVTYKFSISFLEAGLLANEVLISFTTTEAPEIILSPMAVSNGSTSTVFTAHASTSFQTNSSFAYQFYLISLDSTMREYCVDGCTGASRVRFQIPRPGQYILQCRLIAANGKTIMAVQNSTRNLFISAQSIEEALADYDNKTEKDYMWGDDGSVNQRGFFISHLLFEPAASEVVALSDQTSGDLCLKYVKKWANMSSTILQNELPNTPSTRNYVSLASNYARLSCAEDEETLYLLLKIVDQSIARTPTEEYLTTTSYLDAAGIPETTLEMDLVRFYNFSMTRALSNIAHGSSRGRLVPRSGEVSNIVLDLSEMWVKHITTSATSGRLCGWDGTFTSNTPDGESDRSLVPSSDVYPLGLSTIRVAVRCNPEQGKSLSTPFSSFEWCDAVYDITQNERKLVTLAEMFDYPYLSGVQGTNRSETTRVVLVDITTLGDANKLISAVSDGQVAAQTGESDGSDQTCYKVGMTMIADATVRTDVCSENVPYRMWPRKEFGISYEAPFEDSAYLKRTAGIVATPETRNTSKFVVAKSNSLGLYGAYRSRCLDQSQGLQGSVTRVSGMLIGILMIVILVTFLVYLLSVVVVSYVARTNTLADHAEIYVDRDVYGRAVIPINTGLLSTSGTTIMTSAYGDSIRGSAR